MATFVDATGRTMNFEAAAMLMDDTIREEMHFEGSFDTPQKFIEEYAKRHKAKFNEDFAPYTGGNW